MILYHKFNASKQMKSETLDWKKNELSTQRRCLKLAKEKCCLWSSFRYAYFSGVDFFSLFFFVFIYYNTILLRYACAVLVFRQFSIQFFRVFDFHCISTLNSFIYLKYVHSVAVFFCIFCVIHNLSDDFPPNFS